MLRWGLPPDRRESVRSALVIAVVWLFSVGAAGWASSASLPDDATLRGWVAEMKVAERGPFHSIGWFCEDGSVRGAKQGCGEHGGGIQHGRWNERSQALRDGGFLIANVMAEVEPAELIGPAGRPALEQILLERFL